MAQVDQERVNNPRFSPEDRAKRDCEWIDIVKNCVEDFEAMADDIRASLLEIPATPARKKQLRHVGLN
ncbi:hypothetical protein SD71_09710 [Cohnella kolymensis]|uniref:Uncharacterized protein n=1 Tax=Cohnella kolymensis TaxID=1590652 RepID=A0ABR5A6G0_9BACL|nr:hypothetical protein [Cohnella kolymensis]KIL36213.1 hypothetical protein SD71_09710 [Cohnella kolymensis]